MNEIFFFIITIIKLRNSYEQDYNIYFEETEDRKNTAEIVSGP